MSNYHASGRALSLVAKLVQSSLLISPELRTVLEEEATRDLYSLDFFQNRCYYFYFIPHLEIENIASVCEMRGKI